MLPRLPLLWPALSVALIASSCRDDGRDDDVVDDDTAVGDDDVTTGDDDTGTPPGDDDSAIGDDDTGIPADDDPWPAFALGVEYAELGLASAYATTGVTWTKTRLESFAWGAVELHPPVEGVHVYDWSCTDAYVAEYQTAGFTDIQSYLSPLSEWGSVNHVTDVMVHADHMDDYRTWVRSLIERYDGDGVDDMPGLVAPVRYWVVGGEWSGFWPSDDHEDYIELAEATAEEAREAYADVRLGTIPLLMWEVFEGNEPTDEEIEERLAGAPLMHNSFEGIAAILDRPDLFDYVSVHSLGDYTEIPPTLEWLRSEMTARGYSHPIWLDDAFPLGGLANFWGFPAHYPVTADQQDAIWETIEAIALFEEPGYSEGLPWLLGLAGSGTVKKVVTAVGEGAVGIQMGNTEDWMPDDGPSLRQSFAASLGASASFGMVDVTHGAGYAPCDARTPGSVRPAYHNLLLLMDKLGDGDFPVIGRIGTTEGARGYRFERKGWVLYALWHEDGHLELPGEVEIAQPYTLVLGCTIHDALITHAVTDPDAFGPLVEQIEIDDCVLDLELTSVPVFVELDL